jgi:two-component system, NarL family, invasion response regulator UvrY
MIRLFIADDHPIVREGLKRLISENVDMEIVGEAVNGQEMMKRLQESEVDLLLLDISMPGSNFLHTMQRLCTQQPHVKILVLSVHPEETYALRAFKAGASGYLTKNHSPEELTEAIRCIYRGKKYITAFLADRLLQKHGVYDSETTHEILSNREYEILCMLGAGKRLKDIAIELSLSPKTISAHRSHILEKLRLRTTADLIRYSIEHKILM